jgi:serine/threonine-protein kinase
MVPSTPDSLKRRRIDRYELHELVGEGGMGAVYRAIDSRLGRTVAVKTVVAQRSDASQANELRQRFMREALAASRVEHRNVVQVIDFGVTEDGTPYLVMEYLRGRDLGVLLRKSKEPLAIDYVADVMLCVCAALRACHQQGVVHRDLKPSNIFLADTDTGPEIKVLDFGVSKAPVAGDLTQEGQILGTPQYLSPEQVNGKVSPSSDQYALGVLLYVCLTKKLPFEEHQNLSLLRAIEVGRFPGPRAHRPEIPAELEAIILRAMHADPTRRFESVHALGQALWKFASQRGQVEWKNYYFQTPTPAEGKTAKGVPFERIGESDGIPIARAVEPTAPLPEAARTGALLAAATSPQLHVSTKLAKPTPSVPETPTPPPAASGRRWVGVAIAGILLAGGGAVAYRRLAPSPGPAVSVSVPAVAPPLAPAPAAVSKPAEPPRPVAMPAPSAGSTKPAPPPAPARIDSPGSDLAARGSNGTDGTRKSHPARRKRAPALEESSKMTGLDKNGIGIPSN